MTAIVSERERPSQRSEGKTLRVFAFGGGVQSTAVLALCAQKELHYDAILFANVGEDSEHPATLRYVREVSIPYAEAHHLRLIEIHKRRRDGTPDESLYQHIQRSNKSLPIPVRMGNGAPGHRRCTGDFKIRPIARWLREHGATRARPAIVGLGISWDEIHRMRSDSGIVYQKLEYPLIERRLDRAACVEIIRSAGLPIPPKSSCWYCPFHTLRRWQELRQAEPDLFWRSVAMERMLHDRAIQLGHGPVWLTGKGKPLDQVVTADRQLPLFEQEDTCESGYCLT